MITSFPLFQSHIDLAHDYWSKLVLPGDTVIDATCGNGLDTLSLCRLALTPDQGEVLAYDVQLTAIKKTKELLEKNLDSKRIQRVQFIHDCHSRFSGQPAKLIVYNLGYLPRGDKACTTTRETTYQSLCKALQIVVPGGAISITCYPGHPEGKLEEEMILKMMADLSPKEWSCCHHRWLNRHQSPSLLLIFRGLSL